MTEKLTFDINFQLQILHQMIRDDVFLVKSLTVLKDHYFENDYLGYFFKKISSFYSRYEKTPDILFFVNEINKFEPKDRIVYTQYLNRIAQSSASSPIYIKEQLTEFIRRNEFVKLYEKLPDMFQRDPEEAYRLAFSKSEEIVSFSFNALERESFKDFDKELDEANEITNVTPLGIPKIDQALGGGARGGDLVIWLGDSGVGKSIILINNGANTIINGGKILHFNLEGRSTIPKLRYISRISNIEYNRLKTRVDLTKEEIERYEKAKIMCEENLYIVHMASFKVTIEDVLAKCKEVLTTFDAQAIIVDYGDLLTSVEKMEFRHQQTYVFRGLARIAGHFKRPIITATQATRPEGHQESETYYLSQRHVCESYEKVRVGSIILSINRTEDEELNNKLRIAFIKSRDGAKSIKIGCYSDYSKMIPYSINLGFYDPKLLIADESVIPRKESYTPPNTADQVDTNHQKGEDFAQKEEK